MRCYKFLLFLSVVFCAVQAHAQKIVMTIDNVTDEGGEGVKALEWNVKAAVSFGGGGVSVSKAQAGAVTLKKSLGLSTQTFFSKIVKGAVIPKILLEWFDDTNNKYYIMELQNVFVTQVDWLSPECPTCLQLDHQVSFSPEIIKVTDIANNKTFTWNISTNVGL